MMHESSGRLARTVAIAVCGGATIGDEEAFLAYLRHVMRHKFLVLCKGQRYSLYYEMNVVVFEVVGGDHLTPLPVDGGHREENGCWGYVVYEQTEFKLFKGNKKQAQRVDIYEEELKPLHDAVASLFQSYIKAQEDAWYTINTSIEHPNRSGGHDSSMTYTLVAQMATFTITGASSDHHLTDGGATLPDKSLTPAILSSVNLTTSAIPVESLLSTVDTPPAPVCKGVLITAPGGCGKTLLLQRLHGSRTAVCYNKPVSNLSTLFQLAAAKAPCLVLLDDVDKMRDATTLLPFLDNLPVGVMAVATATDVSSVPADLRLPNRLPHLVQLHRPDVSKRMQLLTDVAQSLDLQFESDVLSELGTRSHGACGRDLNHMMIELWSQCRELPAVATQHILHVLESFRTNNQNSHEVRQEVAIAKPKGPHIKVLGYTEEYKYLEQRFRATLDHASVFEKANLAAPSRFLLYGPPGCGKTWLTKAIAEKFSLTIRTITRADVFSKYFGESEVKLDKIFNEAVSCVPCILHFPGFDGLAGCKGEDHHEVEARVLNVLKARMDGAIKLKGLFIIAETSRPDLLDLAIIRRGRFHGYLHMGLPNAADRLTMVQHQLRQMDLNEDQLQQMVDLTKGYTGAEVWSVCKEASVSSMHEAADALQPATSQKQLNKHRLFQEMFPV